MIDPAAGATAASRIRVTKQRQTLTALAWLLCLLSACDKPAEELERGSSQTAIPVPAATALHEQPTAATQAAAQAATLKATVEAKVEPKDYAFQNAAQQPTAKAHPPADAAHHFATVLAKVQAKQLPRAQDVRIGELVAACRYDLYPPAADWAFAIDSEVARCPWNPDRDLVRISYRTRASDPQELPAAHFVLLIDQSGSLQRDHLVGRMRSALTMLLDGLREQDRVTMVVNTHRQTRIVLDSARGDEHVRLQQLLQERSAYADDIGAAELRAAYDHLAHDSLPVQHIVLVTDGCPEQRAMLELAKAHASGRAKLSVFDPRSQPTFSEPLAELATAGGGSSGPIDSQDHARTTLTHAFSGWLQPTMHAVALRVTFDSKLVKSYRMLGFDNHAAEPEQDSRPEPEGVRHPVTADCTVTTLFEVQRHDPSAPFATPGFEVAVDYREPGSDGESSLNSFTSSTRSALPGELSQNGYVAATAAAVGLLLRRDPHCELLQPALLQSMAARIDPEQNPELCQLVAATLDALRNAASSFK